MRLDALAGNDALKEQLAAHSRGRGLAHAYILAGPRGIGKHTLARALAAALVCTGSGERPCGQCAACRKTAGGIHPDIITVAGEPGKDLTVAQIREMRADAYIRPNEAERKVYLIENAQSMNPSAQNAMLKLLEEGPSYAVFLLLAENGTALLPTVRSRCELLALTPLSRQEAEYWLRLRFPKAPPEAVAAAAIRSGGVLGRAVDELSGADQRDQELVCLAERFLDTLSTGDELGRMEMAISLEKWDRDRLAELLDILRSQICQRLSQPQSDQGQRRRLAAAALQLDKLRSACEFNAASGHLAGWLVASCSLLWA